MDHTADAVDDATESMQLESMKRLRRYPNMIWVGAAVCVAGLLTATLALAKKSQVERSGKSSIVQLSAHNVIGAAAMGDDENMDGLMPGEKSADVFKDVRCIMRTDPSGAPTIITFDSQAVVTSSGQVNLVCHGQLPAGSVEPFELAGFNCSVGPAGVTTDSHIVWTPSGQGTLTCHGSIPD